jgi:methionyl-tRNA formyltransferase
VDKNSLNIIFAGTPEFSVVALSALLQANHKIAAVYTQPDRPAGRGRKLTASPVKDLALQHSLPIHQPVTLRDEREQKILKEFNADLMVVVAYGLLLPLAVLKAPRLGCINIHASLLPRWRGAAPIQRAILAGDAETGVTIMQMEQGLDTGPMLYKKTCPILTTDTSHSLHERLAKLGADALITMLDQLAQLTPEVQNNSLATYAHKIAKEEAEIDWQQSAVELDRQIRAFNPWPVSYTTDRGQILRVWEASRLTKECSNVAPGTIMQSSAQGIDVATGESVLRLLKIQLPGARVLPVADVLNARHQEFAPGKILGPANR